MSAPEPASAGPEKRDYWNKCDVCGRFVALADFDAGRAYRNLLTPDSDFSAETWETIHAACDAD